MTTGKIVLVAALAGVLGIGSAILGRQWLGEDQGPELQLPRGADSDLLDRLPEFRLPDTNGEEISSTRWDGKVLLLNFWATWCPPCLREMPLFDEVQRSHAGDGLQVVAIAIDEQEDVKRFLTEHPVGFPILIGDTDAIEMSRRLGNRMQGLPFTAIFDHQGNLVYAKTGEMTRASLSEHLDPLLTGARGSQTPGN